MNPTMMSLKKNQRERKSENASNNEIKDILKSRKGLGDSKNSDNSEESK